MTHVSLPQYMWQIILLSEQAELCIYDPKVSKEKILMDLDVLGTRSEQENRELVSVVSTPIDACTEAHAIAIMTEWDEFISYDWKEIYSKMLKPAFLFDGRAILDRTEMNAIGFNTYVIGKG